MSLDTQKFGLSKHWLAVALDQIVREPQVFAKKHLSTARKAFLAGSRQLPAIKNWLSCSGILETVKGGVQLTDLGRLISAKDPKAESAWTWWLLHMHLCANPDAFPYSTFFLKFDSEGSQWLTTAAVLDVLVEEAKSAGSLVERETVATYFAGVEQTFRPGFHIHELRLIELRVAEDDQNLKRLRRCATVVPDIAVVYAALLFQKTFFPNQQTVEARLLFEKGLARSLGMRETTMREALRRVSQHPELSQFVQHRRQVNLDSVQFVRSGDQPLKALRAQVYGNGDVKWP